MFKQNEYIVILRDASKDTSYVKHGYCFVQKENKSYLSTNKDLTGTSCTASGIFFDNKSLWRYATPEEIAEYDRLGKPFDVTTLKPKELSKEELLEKTKKRYPIGTVYKALDSDGVERSTTTAEFAPRQLLSGIEVGRGFVYNFKLQKWAEIVSKPESVEKMEEPKFIVGKWYKNFLYSKTCARFVKMEDSNFIGDMWISRDGNYIFEKFESSCFDKAELITDLSEIQQYLPEGHPDKFPVSRELTSKAQQKPQTMVQKWAIGTYVVFLKDYGDNPKGTVDRIGKDFGETIQAATKYIFHDSSSLCNMNKNTEVKWFATQKEAEEFAKTLREPEPVKSSVEPEWTPQVGDWVVDSCDVPFKLTSKSDYRCYGETADGSSYSEAIDYIRKALPHEIPSERGPGITAQIESVKDYEVLTEEELRKIVSDPVYTPFEPSPKVDTALPMISFVIPPRDI